MTTLSERLNRIIAAQGVTKTEFARRVGVTKNYIFILTGKNPRKTVISVSLAKLVAVEFGYNEDWILTGEGNER